MVDRVFIALAAVLLYVLYTSNLRSQSHNILRLHQLATEKDSIILTVRDRRQAMKNYLQFFGG